MFCVLHCSYLSESAPPPNASDTGSDGGGEIVLSDFVNDVRVVLGAADTAGSLINLIGTLVLTGGTKKDVVHAAAILICSKSSHVFIHVLSF